jgi:hypothetical protein
MPLRPLLQGSHGREEQTQERIKMTENVALPVFAWKLPIPLGGNKLGKVSSALTTLYGETYMRQVGQHIIFFTDGEVCGCQRCADYLEVLVSGLAGIAVEEHDWLEFQGGMIVCSECGNKRCPHATDHRQECTKSNAPGQLGSSYA